MHPDVIGGRYRVRTAIGQGGMGTVWLCRDETLQRDVAVKQVGLLPGASVTDSARALREARSSAALSHRNVVTVFDVVEEHDAIWLVMEHVPSRSLADLVKQEGPLDPARVADIGAQVADGLAAAHAVGTMHRDVKPGNVLVREDGIAKISDFGIARSAGDPALTQSGLLTGTPSYFSPELARGSAPTPASDVWALGATLYAAVEGRAPYRPRDNPVAVLHEIATQQPPPPTRAGFLEPVLLRMLDRDPDARWSMADAAHALRRLAREHSRDDTRVETLAAAAPSVAPVRPADVPATPTAPGEPDPAPDRAAAPARERPAQGPPVRPGRPRGRRAGYAVLAVVALLLVIGGIGYLVSRAGGSGGSPDASASSTTSRSASTSSSTSPSPSASTSSSPSPSASSSTSPSATGSSSATTSPGTLRSKASFIRGYFAVAPGGTDEAWRKLGPHEQAQGRASYDRFWNGVSRVDVKDIEPVPGTDSVELTITYHLANGRSSTERQRLDLVRAADGGYLIDNDEVIG